MPKRRNMPDVHDPLTRSRNMAAVKSRDTKPELIVRRGLHRRGFRFRLAGKDLPGKPDIILPARNAVIFVHGCFWHGHECHLFRMPQTRRDFWEAKIAANRRRDHIVLGQLGDAGWRCGVIWECALRGRQRLSEQELFAPLTEWLLSGDEIIEISGSGCFSDIQ